MLDLIPVATDLAALPAVLLDLMPAGIGLVAFALGALLVRRRTPYCTCEHGYGTHDQGGPCTAEIKRPCRWSGNSVIDYEWVRCPCKHYDGPEPPAQTFAPYVPWPPT